MSFTHACMPEMDEKLKGNYLGPHLQTNSLAAPSVFVIGAEDAARGRVRVDRLGGKSESSVRQAFVKVVRAKAISFHSNLDGFE
jgi:hypothetical protein